MNVHSFGNSFDCLLTPCKQKPEETVQQNTLQLSTSSGIASELSDTAESILIGALSGYSSQTENNPTYSHHQQSKYITAKLDSFQTQKQFSSTLGSLVTMLPTNLIARNNSKNKYTEAMLNKAKAQRLAREAQNDLIHRKSKENLERARENIEEKAKDVLVADGYAKYSTPEAALEYLDNSQKRLTDMAQQSLAAQAYRASLATVEQTQVDLPTAVQLDTPTATSGGSTPSINVKI